MLLHLTSLLLNKFRSNLIPLLRILEGILQIGHASCQNRRRTMYLCSLFQRVVNFDFLLRNNKLILEIKTPQFQSFGFPYPSIHLFGRITRGKDITSSCRDKRTNVTSFEHVVNKLRSQCHLIPLMEILDEG